MTDFFMKIHGFEQFFKNKKFNVLSIIFNVKTRAGSKKVTNIYQMCRFLALMAKKHILEINYEKYYIYFNKINNFHDNLLKIGMYNLPIVLKGLLKFHKDISNGYRNT